MFEDDKPRTHYGPRWSVAISLSLVLWCIILGVAQCLS